MTSFTLLEPSTDLDVEFIAASAAFDFRFYLTDAELREATAQRKTFWRTTEGKAFTRVITGIGTVYFSAFPYLHGQTWLQFLETSPMKAMYMGALAIFDFWVATGSLGVEYLNGIANRLDLERHVTLSENDVTVIHGRNRHHFKWNELRGFEETANLFLLVTGEHTFWTIPKRTLASTNTSRLRSFLLKKTTQR